MTKANRIDQIVTAMKAGSKSSYLRSGNVDEVKDELLQLQEETVKLTFNEENLKQGNLHISDVWNRLKQLNEERGNIANEELDDFSYDSRALNNAIHSIISGAIGEKSALRTLKMLHCNHRLVNNVALERDGYQGELDMVVFTERTIYLIEVKNALHQVRIEPDGTYYRIKADGAMFSNNHDKNLGEKMNIKEYLLRKTLEDAGFNNFEIRPLIVFTNGAANVENRSVGLRHCYLYELLSTIQDESAPIRYTNDELDRMAMCLTEAGTEYRFPLPLDVQSFKLHFATVLAKLEEPTEQIQEDGLASERKENKETDPDIVKKATKKNEEVGKEIVNAKARATEQPADKVSKSVKTIFAICVPLVLGLAFKKVNPLKNI